MKLFPPFKELLPKTFANDFPSIADNKGVLSEVDATLLSEYLTGCTVVDEWLSPVADPLDRSKQVPNRFWTDGEYYWDEMLPHLVRQYKIRLPRKFIEHAKKNLSNGFFPTNIDLNTVKPEIKQVLISARKGDMSVYDLS